MKKKVWKFSAKMSFVLFGSAVLHYLTVKELVENITWVHELALAIHLGLFGVFVLFGSVFPYVVTVSDKNISTDEMRRHIRQHPIGKYFIIYDMWGDNNE